MLHCYTVPFAALFFMTLLPKDVGVLRRPLTVINITGCRYRLTFEIFSYISAHLSHSSRAALWRQPRIMLQCMRKYGISRIFKPPSGSFSPFVLFFHFTSAVFLLCLASRHSQLPSDSVYLSSFKLTGSVSPALADFSCTANVSIPSGLRI